MGPCLGKWFVSRPTAEYNLQPIWQEDLTRAYRELTLIWGDDQAHLSTKLWPDEQSHWTGSELQCCWVKQFPRCSSKAPRSGGVRSYLQQEQSHELAPLSCGAAELTPRPEEFFRILTQAELCPNFCSQMEVCVLLYAGNQRKKNVWKLFWCDCNSL